MGVSDQVPVLSGDAAKAVAHRGSHIQIIAGAGAGKTETVSQRIASLVAEGADPASIVAFTFTVRAAEELKARVRERVKVMASQEMADRLGTMYVGTIHGYCFQLLTTELGKYESYEVLDETKQSAFLQRHYASLGLAELVAEEKPKRGAVISLFRRSVDVVENELLPLSVLPEPFRTKVQEYYAALDRYRLLTYGLQIQRAVDALEDDEFRAAISTRIAHLFVDEYQDINPAQERLISLLSKPQGGADLVVVGDDDQAIYQWRGSSVQNIITFDSRYEGVVQFQLLANRRSRRTIVDLANAFAATIPNRLKKVMEVIHDDQGATLDIIVNHESEEAEARDIAASIQELRNSGFRYSDIAVLCRTRSAYPRLLEALESEQVPVRPGGRTGLYLQPDADFIGRICAYLGETWWRRKRFDDAAGKVSRDEIEELLKPLYGLRTKGRAAFMLQLDKLHSQVGVDSRKISLVKEMYALLELLPVRDWPDDDAVLNARRGSIGRMLNVLADYEAIQKRAYVNADTGRQVGASDQQKWFWINLGHFLYEAADALQDFEGEDDPDADAVDLLTVHAAKGLEWPVVFIPSLTKNRFPTSNTGKAQEWLVPTDLFERARYEGSDGDERRLFYVAVTRAKQWLSLSAHEKVKKNGVKPSPYIEFAAKEFSAHGYPDEVSAISDGEPAPIELTFSEIADYLNCGYSFWLRNQLEFPPAIVTELGYGNAVHHVLRTVAEDAVRTGKLPTPVDIDRLLATELYLPYANSVLAEQMRASARKLVFKYLNEYAKELKNTWATERPFELALDGVVVSGRADVVMSPDGTALSIMDYKTSMHAEDPNLQLQVYAKAGLREGLQVEAAYVHDLSDATRHEVDLSATALADMEAKVVSAAQGIRNREFDARPEISRCSRCDVAPICRSRGC